jgi:hypothetical protein
MKFFDLELGGLGSMESKHGNPTGGIGCTVSHFAGGNNRLACDKSSDELYGDYYYIQYNRGKICKNKTDHYVYRTRSFCQSLK